MGVGVGVPAYAACSLRGLPDTMFAACIVKNLAPPRHWLTSFCRVVLSVAFMIDAASYGSGTSPVAPRKVHADELCW